MRQATGQLMVVCQANLIKVLRKMTYKTDFRCWNLKLKVSISCYSELLVYSSLSKAILIFKTTINWRTRFLGGHFYKCS